jgi:hypothetical protein
VALLRDAAMLLSLQHPFFVKQLASLGNIAPNAYAKARSPPLAKTPGAAARSLCAGPGNA